MKAPTAEQEEYRRCEDCGAKGATWGSDPFAEEILGDTSRHWLCSKCRKRLEQEI